MINIYKFLLSLIIIIIDLPIIDMLSTPQKYQAYVDVMAAGAVGFPVSASSSYDPHHTEERGRLNFSTSRVGA